MTLERAGRDLRSARTKLAAAMEQAQRKAVEAAGNGVPETEIARTLGVDRMTVRKWLGK